MPNANGFTDIPAFTQADMTNPAGFVRKLEQLREQVQLVIGTRGPGRGNPAWIDQLIDIGVVDDGGRGPRLPPRQPPGSDDKSPPPMPAGLTVTPGINHIFVEITAPTYAQGGGNAYSTIYAATRDPASTDPLPTFGNATAVVTVPYGTEIHAIPTEPNVQWHVWVTHTTYADVEGPPAGGTNGASCVSGRLVGYEHFEALSITNALIANLAVDNAKIANLSASKITAGSLAVGSYIQSSGFVSGFQGFRISGNGDAEFNNAIFRGVVYADGGEIGGAVIDASGVESDNYVANTSGWRLDNASGDVYAVGGGRVGGWEIDGPRSIVRAGGFMRVTGSPFGSASQFIDWYGPDLADLDDCQENNALMYFKTDGSAYFGGSLSAGTLVNSGATSDLSATAEIVVGPFETLGGTKIVVLSYSYRRFYTCDAGTGGVSGTGSATIVIERSLSGGAWVQIGTLSVSNTGLHTPSPGPGDPDSVFFNMGGSVTVTDTSAATTNMRLRGRITARTLPSFAGANKMGDSPSQRVSVSSTEE